MGKNLPHKIKHVTLGNISNTLTCTSNKKTRSKSDAHQNDDNWYDYTIQIAKESVFAAKHPFIAKEIGVDSFDGENISSIAKRFSILGDVLKKNKDYAQWGRGDEPNAMRHALWSAMICSKHGVDIAMEVGNARETKPDLLNDHSILEPIYLIKEADSMVDQLNNTIGRKIALLNPNKTTKELALLVLDEFWKNGLFTCDIIHDEPNKGWYKINKKTITEEQYLKLKIEINTANNLGINPKMKTRIDKYIKNRNENYVNTMKWIGR